MINVQSFSNLVSIIWNKRDDEYAERKNALGPVAVSGIAGDRQGTGIPGRECLVIITTAAIRQGVAASCFGGWIPRSFRPTFHQEGSAALAGFLFFPLDHLDVLVNNTGDLIARQAWNSWIWTTTGG
jgi:hypothetical protein